MSAVSAGTTRRPSPLKREQRVWGWIFLSPWIIGFLAFTILPILASLVFSFTNFVLVQPEATEFVGLDNWRRMLADPLVHRSLAVTVRFLAISVPLSLALPLLLDYARPDLLFYNAGVDPHRDDKLGKLALTDEGLRLRDRTVGKL